MHSLGIVNNKSRKFEQNRDNVPLTFKYYAGVEKEDTVPTILFSKEKLEMPLKENDGKIAEAANQPSMFCSVCSNVYKLSLFI